MHPDSTLITPENRVKTLTFVAETPRTASFERSFLIFSRLWFVLFEIFKELSGTGEPSELSIRVRILLYFLYSSKVVDKIDLLI